MFIIDGSKALRAAINAVFGVDHPVQRCRAQAAERARPPSRGAEGAGQEPAASGLEDGVEGGHGAYPQAVRVVGARVDCFDFGGYLWVYLMGEADN